MTLAANMSFKPDQEILDLAIVQGLGVPVLVEADMAATGRQRSLGVEMPVAAVRILKSMEAAGPPHWRDPG